MQAEAAGQTAATIPWSKYTHIIHSALRPTYTNGICGLDSNSGLLSASNVTDFVNAAHASDVKAIVGIREDDTRDAITACTAPQNIAQFVELIRTFVANSGYDGVDLDWESGIIAPQYQDLIRRLRTAMPTATLSVAVGIAERFMTAAVQDDVDQINIRAYNLDSHDLTGSAVHYSWFHSATLQGANTQDQAMDSLSWSYVYAGNASSKLGLAVPFYGRIRKGCLNDSGANGVTDPNQAWVGRAEISSILYRDLVNSKYWSAGTRVWDDSRKSQYIQYRDGACAKDAFIPYLGPEQLQEIVSLIRANKLGGIATYSLPNEYIATEGGDARYPLSTAIDAAMSATASASVISKRSRLAATPSSSVTKAAAGASSTPPSITSPLPTALTGAPYSQTLTVTGTTPMTWTVTSGALPSGLTLGSSTGIISGMPAAPGIFTLTVTATNAVGSNYQQLSLTVNAPPTIVTTSPLPAALTGTAYSLTLAATGTTPMTWTVTGGALPSGLTLGSSTGTISGTPTAVGVFTPTVSATNALGSNSRPLSVTVNAPTPPLIVSTSPLPTALTGTAYSQTLTATGATPMTWTVTSGALPSGLTLGSSTGTISGMPTALGVFTPTLTATNAGGSNSRQLSLTVNAPATPPSIVTTSPLPAALTGAAYSQTLTATGTTPMTWTVTGGALPSGLTLGSSTGTISGTPTTTGVFAPTVTATNAGGSNSKQLSLTVNAPATPPSIATTSPLPAALTGTAYSQTLTATGTTPMTWTVTSGALPSGLTLGSSTGTISGTPTTTGVFTPTVTATNAGGSNSKQLSLTVNAPATPPSIVTTSPLPAALTGAAYSQTLTATGTTPMTWAVTSGALPSGLTLGSSTGTISGTPTTTGVFTPTVTATNADGSNSKQLSLTVNAPAGGAQTFTYYVDPSGSDASNGLTPATAWRTIAKVNATTLSPGQSVGFKSGGLWRDILIPNNSGTAGSPITYGAYGTGEKPVISGANLKNSGWTQISPTVWQSSVTTEPKLVFFDGTAGTKVASVAVITSPGQWYWASSVLHVYSASDPATAFTSPGVEVPARWAAIYSYNVQHIRLQNFQTRGSTNHGLQLDGDVSDTTVDGIVSSYNEGIGIAVLSSGDTARTVTGLVISNSEVYYNVEDGIAANALDTANPATIYDGLHITGIISHHNVQTPMNNSFGAGIHVGSPSTYAAKLLYSMRNCLIENSTSYSNGRNAAGAYIAGTNSGVGIWLDTTSGCEVRYSQSYDNMLSGISGENGTANKFHHNITWGMRILLPTGISGREEYTLGRVAPIS